MMSLLFLGGRRTALNTSMYGFFNGWMVVCQPIARCFGHVSGCSFGGTFGTCVLVLWGPNMLSLIAFFIVLQQ